MNDIQKRERIYEIIVFIELIIVMVFAFAIL